MKKQKSISATDLAKLGVCEHQALHRANGTPVKRSRASNKAVNRGNKIHKEHENNTQKYQKDQRCFIASELYGPTANETEFLREWRDRVLQSSWWGRCLIQIYYSVSPSAVAVSKKSPQVRVIAKYGVRQVLTRTGWNEHESNQ
jgi:hypothetical protein